MCLKIVWYFFVGWQQENEDTTLDSILEKTSISEDEEEQKCTENSKDANKNSLSSLEDYNLLADLDVSW